MTYSIREIIYRLVAPQHNLSCSWFLWNRLVKDLQHRGQNQSRESGAFLLGHKKEGRSRIIEYVLYDDLDPNSLDTGIVRFDGRYFSDLWAICEQRRLSVVADIHVHPGSSGQSRSDKEHPMISRAGHMALILPNFARSPLKRRNIGIFQYLGAKEWKTVPLKEKDAFFHVGL